MLISIEKLDKASQSNSSIENEIKACCKDVTFGELPDDHPNLIWVNKFSEWDIIDWSETVEKLPIKMMNAVKEIDDKFSDDNAHLFMK